MGLGLDYILVQPTKNRSNFPSIEGNRNELKPHTQIPLPICSLIVTL